jgi:hypothetical protein
MEIRKEWCSSFELSNAGTESSGCAGHVVQDTQGVAKVLRALWQVIAGHTSRVDAYIGVLLQLFAVDLWRVRRIDAVQAANS